MTTDGGGWLLAMIWNYSAWGDLSGTVHVTSGTDTTLIEPSDDQEIFRFFDVVEHGQVRIENTVGEMTRWVVQEGPYVADGGGDFTYYTSPCGLEGHEAETCGQSGDCGDSWISPYNNYAGQNNSYFSICNAGVATCPPNGWGGCGYSYNQVRDLHPVQSNSFAAGTDHLTSVWLR
jgi:hypothetical protein